MITVVTYLWGRKHYQPKHVQRLAASVDRWLAAPHRFRCITDQSIEGVTTLPDLGRTYPARCYRRLWLFSPRACDVGDQILHLDLDLVICGPLDGLVPRASNLAIYKAGSIAAQGYSLNPSVLWLRTGTQTDLWTRFTANPTRLAAAANQDGFWGSDQAILSHLRKDAGVDTVGDADGVVSFRRIRHEQLTAPHPGTRIVSFHGRRTPFEKDVQAAHPWIVQAWQEAA